MLIGLYSWYVMAIILIRRLAVTFNDSHQLPDELYVDFKFAKTTANSIRIFSRLEAKTVA
jgi:hypothetical protein